MKFLTFFVPGKVPATQRARARRRGQHAQVYDPECNKFNAQSVRDIFTRDFPGWGPVEGPIVATIEARFMPPKTNYWPGKECMVKPDWDNIGKLPGDALNRVAYRDDSQIIDGRCIKRYCLPGEVEGIEVRLEFHEPTPRPKKERAKKQ